MQHHQEANSADCAEVCAENDPATWTIADDGFADGGTPYSDEELYTPDESDDYISDDRDGYSVTHDERNIGTYPTLRRAEACLYLARARSNYWPNIWRVNERGNTTLCVFDSHVLRATDIGYV